MALTFLTVKAVKILSIAMTAINSMSVNPLEFGMFKFEAKTVFRLSILEKRVYRFDQERIAYAMQEAYPTKLV